MLEFYKHDTLNLGLLHSNVSWTAQTGAKAVIHTSSVTMVDGRCAADDRCPTGQGFYHQATLATIGNVQAASRPDGAGHDEAHANMGVSEAVVRLTVVPRPGDASKGGKNESDFSIVSLINEGL